MAVFAVNQAGKQGKEKPMRMHFSTNEKIILVKEVIACKEHVDEFSFVKKKFEMAADTIKADPSFCFRSKATPCKGRLKNW